MLKTISRPPRKTIPKIPASFDEFVKLIFRGADQKTNPTIT